MHFSQPPSSQGLGSSIGRASHQRCDIQVLQFNAQDYVDLSCCMAVSFFVKHLAFYVIMTEASIIFMYVVHYSFCRSRRESVAVNVMEDGGTNT